MAYMYVQSQCNKACVTRRAICVVTVVRGEQVRSSELCCCRVIDPVSRVLFTTCVGHRATAVRLKLRCTCTCGWHRRQLISSERRASIRQQEQPATVVSCLISCDDVEWCRQVRLSRLSSCCLLTFPPSSCAAMVGAMEGRVPHFSQGLVLWFGQIRWEVDESMRLSWEGTTQCLRLRINQHVCDLCSCRPIRIHDHYCICLNSWQVSWWYGKIIELQFVLLHLVSSYRFKSA